MSICRKLGISIGVDRPRRLLPLSMMEFNRPTRTWTFGPIRARLLGMESITTETVGPMTSTAGTLYLTITNPNRSVRIATALPLPALQQPGAITDWGSSERLTIPRSSRSRCLMATASLALQTLQPPCVMRQESMRQEMVSGTLPIWSTIPGVAAQRQPPSTTRLSLGQPSDETALERRTCSHQATGLQRPSVNRQPKRQTFLG